MESVRPHLDANDTDSVRGLFVAQSVSPALGLRYVIMTAKANYINSLASGATGDAEEDKIRDVMAGSENSYELVRMMEAIGGWSGLDDELPESYLDPIARQIAQTLDQRDYRVHQLIRRHFALLDYQACPTLGDCFLRVLGWPQQFIAGEIDYILDLKPEILADIASATLRQRAAMVNAARVHPDVIARYVAVAPHRAKDMIALMHEAIYTGRICTSLAELDYQPLYAVITDMVKPATAITNAQRIACKDTCLRLTSAFGAARIAVDAIGSNAAKATINRFMLALKAALDNFPATVPAPTAVGAIAAALGAVGSTVTDLQTAITNLPDALAGAISLGAITGSGDDDKARTAISQMHAQGWLGDAPFKVKIHLVNACLSGFTVDDDEVAINRVLETAKARNQAELYQLTAAATWESLYSGMDGDEYDALEGMLQHPS